MQMNMKDIASGVEVVVEVTGMTRYQARIWLARVLMSLAGKILNMTVTFVAKELTKETATQPAPTEVK